MLTGRPVHAAAAGRPGRVAVARRAAAGALALTLAACSGPQSALDPAGDAAEAIAGLFWVLLAGAAVIWALVIGAAVFALRFKTRPISERAGLRLVLWGGAVVPTLILSVLLVYGLRLMPLLRDPAAELRVEVVGEQFWWRVTYRPEGGPAVVSANEVRVPVGARVEFSLDAADVIHSFWIPALGGKVDMIPGRSNRLALRATRTGTFRGVCAEFCGPAHTRMAFPVVVMEPEAFRAWLAEQAREASPAGNETFLANGCGGCHAVRGTPATGTIGPDLTHLASRLSLGADLLPNDAASRARFVAEVDTLKPGARMPGFGMLPPAEAAAIADYLGSLE
ncbi:cytochrome c oxidase subunit II [Ancylobacter lacus]|nr:cytochrome c oxidase subunit II [Ancylobacter lacus]MBS7539589.1 cytochrome c oxidase subunit II [Ancylobacter lacus]